MRVLLDECVPKRFGPLVAGHAVRTVPQEGWSGKRNGELLALMAAAGYEVLFLTVDQGVRHQQNLRAAGVAVVVMVSPSNQLADLAPLVPKVLTALSTIQPGDVVEVRALPGCTGPQQKRLYCGLLSCVVRWL